jgi:hypothetical protein
VFWLKLWNAVAFGGAGHRPAAALRPGAAAAGSSALDGQPALLWGLIAGGHLNVLAAGFGLLGLLALGRDTGAVRPGLPRALGAGALIGIAADIKINYALFGLAVAWVLRRSPAALAAAALAVLVPGYAVFGLPAVKGVLGRHNADNFYEVFVYPHQLWRREIAVIAVLLVIVMAAVLLRCLPPGAPGRPVIRPALAFSVAWLFFWPYQLPWYETMIICLLVLYPATRLDWLVLMRLSASTISNMPGNSWFARATRLTVVDHYLVLVVTPLVLLAAAAGLIGLCLSGQWNRRQPAAPLTDPPGVMPTSL